MTEERIITKSDEEVFNQVAKIGEEFRTESLKSSFSSKDWYSERLNALTGAFMYLSPRYSQVRTVRVNNEVNEYIRMKTHTMATNEKFVSVVAERAARASVNEFALAEHTLESYKLAAETGILTAKKQLDNIQNEFQREGK